MDRVENKLKKKSLQVELWARCSVAKLDGMNSAKRKAIFFYNPEKRNHKKKTHNFANNRELYYFI